MEASRSMHRQSRHPLLPLLCACACIAVVFVLSWFDWFVRQSAVAFGSRCAVRRPPKRQKQKEDEADRTVFPFAFVSPRPIDRQQQPQPHAAAASRDDGGRESSQQLLVVTADRTAQHSTARRWRGVRSVPQPSKATQRLLLPLAPRPPEARCSFCARDPSPPHGQHADARRSALCARCSGRACDGGRGCSSA